MRTIHIPGYEARGVAVDAGETIRLIDVEGTQIADLFAHDTTPSHHHLCTGRTRLVTSRLFPQPGDAFVTTSYEPILTLVTDDSPGVHDMLYEACDPTLHEFLGGSADHPSCHDNYRRAVADLNVPPGPVPSPVNFFQSTPVGPDGTLSSSAAPTAPGDSVTLRAEIDLFLIVAACSVDAGAEINGGRSTALRLEIC